jgi:hypothetical protein
MNFCLCLMVKNVSEVQRSEFQSIMVLAEVTKSFHDLSFESLPQRVRVDFFLFSYASFFPSSFCSLVKVE